MRIFPCSQLEPKQAGEFLFAEVLEGSVCWVVQASGEDAD